MILEFMTSRENQQFTEFVVTRGLHTARISSRSALNVINKERWWILSSEKKYEKMEYSACRERPTGARKVMGSIPVGDSDFFFVPRSRHAEYSIFSYLKLFI